MNVKIQKRQKKEQINYHLLVQYKKDGKYTTKSLGKSSSDLMAIENYKYRLNNKIKQNNLKDKDIEDVIHLAEEMFDEDSFIVNSKFTSNVLFKDYSKDIIDYKYQIKNISEKTYISYINALKHLNSFFGETKVCNLKTRMINDYIIEKMKKISTSTLDTHLTVLKIIVKSALRDDILIKDILIGIEKPKKEKKETYIYSEDEVGLLMKTLNESNLIELRLKVLLILKLGLRNSEVLGLCWDAIDMKNQTIHIHRITSKSIIGETTLENRTKSVKSDRYLRISNQLLDELKEYKKYQLANNQMCDLQLLFHKNGKPIAQNIFTNEFSSFLLKNNLPKTNVHGLRHFYGSLLIKNGIPITEVSKNMGHSNPAITTSIYIHELDDITKKTVDLDLMDDLYKDIL